jgi:hypothetical protein
MIPQGTEARGLIVLLQLLDGGTCSVSMQLIGAYDYVEGGKIFITRF